MALPFLPAGFPSVCCLVCLQGSLAFELLDSWSYSCFFPPFNSSPTSFDNSPYHTNNMFIIEKWWKKVAPVNSALYEYQQQQYIFKSGAGPGLLYVVEVNTHHNSQMAKWPFPSFYRSYLGHLIYRWALYIKMWELQKSRAIASLPNLSMILKHLRHLASFTDQVVEACLTEASQHNVGEPHTLGLKHWMVKLI